MNQLVFTGLPYNQQLKKRKESRTQRNIIDGSYIEELESILDKVCKHLELDVPRIKAKGRTRTNANARFYYFYLAKRYTEYSLASIGAVVGKDHATVIYGIRQINNFIGCDKEVCRTIEALEELMLCK